MTKGRERAETKEGEEKEKECEMGRGGRKMKEKNSEAHAPRRARTPTVMLQTWGSCEYLSDDNC